MTMKPCVFMLALTLAVPAAARDGVLERLERLERENAMLEKSLLALRGLAVPHEEARLNVLDTEHSRGVVGQYFYFDIETMNAVVGRDDWNWEAFLIRNMRSGQVGIAVFWASTDHEEQNGNGHGRWISSALVSNNDWEVDDTMEIRQSLGSWLAFERGP